MGFVQHENVQPTETEDMLQIWKALKLLLLKHSAERQVQGQADRHGKLLEPLH